MTTRKDLVRSSPTRGTLEERLRAQLAQKFGLGASGAGTYGSEVALLLDVSGSMDAMIGANVRAIDELRKLAREFAGIRKFEFSSTCSELPPGQDISDPHGGTAMHGAFLKVRSAGVTHVVLITDGAPDHAQNALDAARGLKVDVFYIGPDPAPEFLRRLCDQTGGSYGRATLQARKELESRVRALLPPPAGASGGIKL